MFEQVFGLPLFRGLAQHILDLMGHNFFSELILHKC